MVLGVRCWVLGDGQWVLGTVFLSTKSEISKFETIFKFQIQMFQKLSIGDLGFVSDLEY